MTSRAFFHYILAFTVLFASSFAVFHSSEHIPDQKIDPSIASFTKTYSDHFHSYDEHNNDEDIDSSGNNHSVESLCKACLLFSNVAAYGLDYTNLSISPEKTKHTLLGVVHSKQQPFQTYLSRAPPSKT